MMYKNISLQSVSYQLIGTSSFISLFSLVSPFLFSSQFHFPVDDGIRGPGTSELYFSSIFHVQKKNIYIGFKVLEIWTMRMLAQSRKWINPSEKKKIIICHVSLWKQIFYVWIHAVQTVWYMPVLISPANLARAPACLISLQSAALGAH